MTFQIGIVAHVQRREQAQRLMADVEADYIHMDDGTLGCDESHRRVWTWLLQNNSVCDHLVVLEDDAIPVPGFRGQLQMALDVAPCDIVSLYLGTSRPPQWQHQIRQAIKHADSTNASWITTQGFIHGVAVAIRTELIPDMLNHTRECPKGFDFAIRDWARTTNRDIAFTHPSQVDHHDSPTLIAQHPDGEPRRRPRKAHRFGVRNVWTDKAIPIP